MKVEASRTTSMKTRARRSGRTRPTIFIGRSSSGCGGSGGRSCPTGAGTFAGEGGVHLLDGGRRRRGAVRGARRLRNDGACRPDEAGRGGRRRPDDNSGGRRRRNGAAPCAAAPAGPAAAGRRRRSDGLYNAAGRRRLKDGDGRRRRGPCGGRRRHNGGALNNAATTTPYLPGNRSASASAARCLGEDHPRPRSASPWTPRRPPRSLWYRGPS